VSFCEDIRRACRATVASARWVRIDDEALVRIGAGEPPRLDPADHYLDGPPEAVATYVLALDAVNFGSGWFAELSAQGPFGYETVAAALATRFRGPRPWTAASLGALTRDEVAATFALPAGHALTGHFTAALRELGAFLGDRGALAVIAAADGSAERMAAQLAAGMAMWRDPLAKRAQLAASDLALAGVATFDDLAALTIFADNLVPHVLRRDGGLVLDAALAEHLDRGLELAPGEQERELRAAAVVAGERLALHLGVSERDLDGMLWQRGQAPRYAHPPAHRCRTTAY
jgi:Potential Queuosine, Q, salvage protein family